MCPEVDCRLTCEEYWNAGCCGDKRGSWPTTPRPRTVSNVPDKLKIRQCRSRNWTANSPKFSRRMQYRHFTQKVNF